MNLHKKSIKFKDLFEQSENNNFKTLYITKENYFEWGKLLDSELGPVLFIKYRGDGIRLVINCFWYDILLSANFDFPLIINESELRNVILEQILNIKTTEGCDLYDKEIYFEDVKNAIEIGIKNNLISIKNLNNNEI